MNKFSSSLFKIGLIVIWGLLGYFLLDLPVTKEIEKDYPVIAYQTQNENFSEATTIKIKGKLTKRIFSGNEFIGKITYHDVVSKADKEYDLWFVKSENANNMGGRIERPLPHNGTVVQFPESIASIFLSKDLKNLTIWLENEDQIKMAGPATTREEAININNKILDIK